MKIDVESNSSGVIFHLEGKIIGDSSSQLRQAIEEQINSGVRWIIMDMAEVPLMDSSALGAVIMGFLKLQEKKGKLVLLYAQKNVLDVLTITKLTSLFEVYDDMQSALKSVEVYNQNNNLRKTT